MTIKEMAEEATRTEQTVRRWVKDYDIPHTKNITREIMVSRADWEKFCREKNIVRRPAGK